MSTREQRQRLAYEAARLMAREGIADARQARHKAARLLGITDKSLLPDEGQIRSQLREYQGLFGKPGLDAGLLRRKREAALSAMSYFSRFQPRLAGAVLDGTAAAHSAIVLHLHADELESVARVLTDAAIPAVTSFVRLRTRNEQREDFPQWSFIADEQPFELLALPLALLRQSPLDADGKPMQRASAATLTALLAREAGSLSTSTNVPST